MKINSIQTCLALVLEVDEKIVFVSLKKPNIVLIFLMAIFIPALSTAEHHMTRFLVLIITNRLTRNDTTEYTDLHSVIYLMRTPLWKPFSCRQAYNKKGVILLSRQKTK